MQDFTVKIFRLLPKTFVETEYTFQTFEGFTENPEHKVIVLRYDVDIWINEC